MLVIVTSEGVHPSDSFAQRDAELVIVAALSSKGSAGEDLDSHR